MQYNNDITVGSFEGWGQTHPLLLSTSERASHVYIVGQTGTGKSTLLKHQLLQDIHAGRGCGLIDVHGDLARELLDFIPKRRIEDVVYLDVRDHGFPFAWNLLHVDNPGQEARELVAACIVSALKSVWRQSWGQNLDYYLSNAILTVIEAGDSFLGVSRLFSDPDYRAQCLRRTDNAVLRNFWLREYPMRTKQGQGDATAPIFNRIGKLALSSTVRHIFGQTASKVSARQIMERGSIFIANLSKGSIGEDNASLMGAMIVSQFFLAALERQSIPEHQRRPFFLAIDEFQNIGSDNFATILSEARKYGLGMTLAHQYMAQLPEPVWDAVIGNVGTFLSLRVGERDAATLARQYGESFPAERFTGLKNFELCAKLISTGIHRDPVVGSTYRPQELEPARRGHRARIIRRSRRRYARRRVLVEEELQRWMH